MCKFKKKRQMTQLIRGPARSNFHKDPEAFVGIREFSTQPLNWINTTHKKREKNLLSNLSINMQPRCTDTADKMIHFRGYFMVFF